MTGNSFDQTTFTYGGAKKVWREIRHRFPGGYVISNVSAWVSAGIIPAGTPLQFGSGKNATALKTVTAESTVDAYTQEDVVIKDANTVATCTAVYDGELNAYMYSAADVTNLNGKVAGVKFV